MSPRHQTASGRSGSIAARTASSAWRLAWTSEMTATRIGGVERYRWHAGRRWRLQGRWWSGRSPPGCCSTRGCRRSTFRGVEPRDWFSAAELERIERYRRLPRWLWVASTVVQLLVLAALAWQGRRLAAVRCTGDPWANPQGRPRRPRLRPRGLDVHPAARGGVALLAPPLRALGAGLRRVARRPGRHAGRDRDPRRCRGQRRARARPALRPPLVDSGRRCARAARRRLRAPAASRGRAALQPLRAARAIPRSPRESSSSPIGSASAWTGSTWRMRAAGRRPRTP